MLDFTNQIYKLFNIKIEKRVFVRSVRKIMNKIRNFIIKIKIKMKYVKLTDITVKLQVQI